MCFIQIPLPDSHTSLQVTMNGQLDAIAVWFDLHLDKQTSFSTAPSWDISWEQAVFPVKEDLCVEKGDVVHLHASCTDTLLRMVVEDIERPESTVCGDGGVCVSGVGTSTTSTNKDTTQLQYNGVPPNSASTNTHGEINSSSGDFEQTLMDVDNIERQASNEDSDSVLAQVCPKRTFYVERSELSRLNDAGYIECYRRALSEAIAVAKSSEEDDDNSDLESSSSENEEDCLVLDMTRGLSLLGLIALKEGQHVLITLL